MHLHVQCTIGTHVNVSYTDYSKWILLCNIKNLLLEIENGLKSISICSLRMTH